MNLSIVGKVMFQVDKQPENEENAPVSLSNRSCSKKFKRLTLSFGLPFVSRLAQVRTPFCLPTESNQLSTLPQVVLALVLQLKPALLFNPKPAFVGLHSTLASGAKNRLGSTAHRNQATLAGRLDSLPRLPQEGKNGADSQFQIPSGSELPQHNENQRTRSRKAYI